MSPFVKLKDPVTYVACAWNFSQDAEARRYWVELFKRHYGTLLKLGVDAAVQRGEARESAQARADRCRTEFLGQLDQFNADPMSQGHVTMLTFDEWRDGKLREHGFYDCFIDLKHVENDLALRLLPKVCRQLDAIAERGEQIRALVENIFAGNVFDMGAEETARKIVAGTLDFFATRESLPRRPWLIDQFGELQRAWMKRPYHKLVIFVDNAGSDFILGVVPLARWFAGQGTQVILAANETPALNDMTAHDIRAWWPAIVEAEATLRDPPIVAISTGTAEPLIDLSRVSDELNAAAHDADLVILEGMGRGVESNLHAEFNCDAANLAMLKDPMSAKYAGGKIYDVVCRFR